MDFKAVFRLLLDNFSQSKIDFAIIGGIALQIGGFMRATRDIDLLIAKEDMPAAKNIMLSLGYDLLHESQDVGNFLSKLPALGAVDFLLAHRKYAKAMLARAKREKIFDGEYSVKVVIPEDLIGLKVQSSSNDSERYHQDMADIEYLLKANYGKIDMSLVEEYFKIFDRDNELKEILGKIKNAQ